MTEMSNKEVLSFGNKELENDQSRFDNRPMVDGSSALKPNPSEYNSDAKTDEELLSDVKKYVTESALITNFPSAEVQKAPRGMVGPVGNQGREDNGGDRTGGEKKKGRGIRVLAGVMAVAAAVGGTAYGLFKDKINSFFGIGESDPNSLPPTYSAGASGEMASQSPEIETPTPSAEVATPSPSPEATETPVATDNAEEVAPTVTPQVTTGKTEAAPGILKGKDKERAEVNQRFEDFLNGTGEFTDEKLKDNGFVSPYSDKKDLGCIDTYQENIFAVQGVMLCYEKIDDGEVFAFGTKDKNNERMITLVELPSRLFIENDGRIGFLIYSESSLFSNPTVKYFGQRDSSYYDFLKSYMNAVFSLAICTCASSSFPDYDFLSDGIKKTLSESFDPKIEISSSFMTNVNFVDTKDHQFANSSESTKWFFEAKKKTIVTVSNFDEFDELLKNGDYGGIPSVTNLCFVNSG